jgi:hypothetical protein
VQVARKDDSFESWKAEFDPVEARFVKLRASRRTILHFSQVQVLRP